ncbi:MAG TPA: hypothetical protein VMX18_00315 [Candidatus Bipolaricaulota bacterium]|nr:hypothetical protein [Candidatus Bipolaricaulota bacterium]
MKFLAALLAMLTIYSGWQATKNIIFLFGAVKDRERYEELRSTVHGPFALVESYVILPVSVCLIFFFMTLLAAGIALET